MRALVFKEGLSYRDDYPVPVPSDNEALIRVRCAGICNTDVEILKGYMGFSGILEKRGIKTMPAPVPKEKIFDIVVDATGSPASLETAIHIVRPRGKIIIKTTVVKRGAVDLSRVVIDELTLIGSRCGPFPPAIKALETKSVDVRPLISKVFAIEEGIEAFQYAARKGVLKVLLRID